MPPKKPPAPSDDAPAFRRGASAVVGKNADKRRTTVYFDLAVARDLARYCADRDANMSDAVNRAVREFLQRSK